MNKEIIETALNSALALLKNEIDNIEFDELRADYLMVIENLQDAIDEFNKKY